MMKKNVMVIIPKLGLGGAELFLLNILPKLQEYFNIYLVCLDGKGVLSRKFKEANIAVEYLNFFNVLSLPWVLYKALILKRDRNIHLIHSFLYPSDFLSSLLKIFSSRKVAIIWSIRLSKLPRNVKLSTKLLRFFAVLFSRFIPNITISCGQEALEYHKQIGYDTSRALVIPNFPAEWTENTKSSSSFLLKNHPDEITVGLAARFTTGKGHHLLCEILRLNQNDNEALFKVKASFCGLHTESGGDLFKFISEQYPDVIERCSFNGQIIETDYHSWISSIDLYALTSNSIEGNPNSFLEASSIGIPIIGTEIGSSTLMAAPECLVPLQNLSAETFYAGIKFWAELNLDERLNLIEKNKKMVELNFDKNKIIKSYIENYNLLLKD